MKILIMASGCAVLGGELFATPLGFRIINEKSFLIKERIL